MQVKTKTGITVNITETTLDPETALNPVFNSIDRARGALFSSGFDYPGRHSRWYIGFTNPALVFSAKER